MTTTRVQPDLTEPEARATALAIIRKDGLQGNEYLLLRLLEAQEEDIKALNDALRYQGETFETFKGLVCKAMSSIADYNFRTGYSGDSEILQERAEVDGNYYRGLTAHSHPLWTNEALEDVRALAALDTSGYAPKPHESPPYEGDRYETRADADRAGTLVPGTGTADTPPRYEPRDSRTYLPPKTERKVPS